MLLLSYHSLTDRLAGRGRHHLLWHTAPQLGHRVGACRYLTGQSKGAGLNQAELAWVLLSHLGLGVRVFLI